MKRKSNLEIWTVFTISIILLYVLFLVYPLFGILKQSIITDGDHFTFKHFVKFFSQPYYSKTLFNSFQVSIAATILSLILGIPLAYFMTAYEIKGKSFLQVVIILCSMSAPFIGAYAWILLLGRSGAITQLIKSLTGIVIPSIYGFDGILLVLSTRLFPLVFLYVSGALKNIDNSLLEAAENMGSTGIKRFYKVIFPLIMPSILAASLMVFMRSMADFGTPLLIGEGYRTFPVEIYKQYVGETGGNHNFAAAISVVAIVITALVFLVQKYLSSHYTFSINSLYPIEKKTPKGIKSILMHAYAYILVSISMLPQIYVIYTSFLKTTTSGAVFKEGYSLKSYTLAFKRMGNAIPNTIFISGTTLIIVVIISIIIAYLVVRRRNTANNIIDTMSMIPHIIPGSVVGIALVIAFSKQPLVLTGTFMIMVISLAIRRLPYTIRSSVAVLQQIPMSIEEAAISLGASKMKTFFKITVPMMANGIIAGAIISWVTIITELSSSIILYNAKTITLTLSIYSLVTRGVYGPAAAVSTILTIFTILSLLIFMRVSKSKEFVL